MDPLGGLGLRGCISPASDWTGTETKLSFSVIYT